MAHRHKSFRRRKVFQPIRKSVIDFPATKPEAHRFSVEQALNQPDYEKARKMRITTIATAALVSTMLGLSGAAYAQTMIGNQTLSEADAERVKTYCEDLKLESEQAVSGSAEEATPEAEGSEDSGAMVGTLDLSTVTLEQCIEAGFVEG